MKNKHIAPIFFGLLMGVLALSCTKPTPFGSELLEDQIADFDGELLPVNCTVMLEDSVITSDRTGDFSHFMVGTINDPVFGSSTSEIFTQFTRSGASYDFTNATLDSVFMVIPYVASAVYGDTLVAQTLQVFQLTDTLSVSKNYYSNETIPFGQEIGRLDNFFPKPRTTQKFLDTAASATRLAFVKFPLTNEFGNYLLQRDSATMADDLNFWRETKGLRITSTPSSAPGAMLAFNLNSNNCFIRLYYSLNDSTHKVYNYYMNDLNANKFMNFKHDYSGSEAGAALDVLNPDYLYMQGMAGLLLKVEFPTAPGYDSILVNKAELEMNGLDNDLFPLANQLVYYTFRGDTIYDETSDADYSRTLTGGLLSLFGGTPSDKGAYHTHKLTMSKYFQDIVDSDPNDPKARPIYVRISLQALTPRRTIFYGPNQADQPIKLRLKYTKL